MRDELYDKDWTFLLQFSYRINQIDDVAAFQYTCLEQLKVLIPSAKSVFFLAERRGAQTVMHLPVAINSEDIQFDENRYTARKFVSTYQEYFFAPWSSAFRHSDNRGEPLLREDSPLYREVYAPQGLYYGLRIVLIHNDHLLGDIGMFRRKEDVDFSNRELRIANLIKDILALRLYQLLHTSEPVQSAMPPILEADRYGFTRREEEVLKLIRDGHSDEEICRELFISLSTLRKHIHKLYQKTGAKNRVQMLKLAQGVGLHPSNGK